MHKSFAISTALSLPQLFPRRRTAVVHRSRPASVSSEKNRLWLAYGLIAFILAMLVVSILGVNFYAAKGYIIKDLQNKIFKLSEENQKLMIRAAEAGSVLQMQEALTMQGYVPVAATDYVPVTQLSHR